jgi:hypothetical protein
MGRIILLVLLLSASCLLSAQGFPCAQKQPKLVEQKANQRKFAKRAHRRHIKRGTVYFQPDNEAILQEPICLLADKRSLRQLA